MKIRELFTGKVCTISNFLSLSRVLFVPFIWYVLYLEKETGNTAYRYYCLVLFMVMFATDYFDGYLARRLNQVSRLGQFLDPIADKISSTSSALLLYYYRDLPLWIILVLLGREAIILIGGALLFSRKDIQVRPNFMGKCMVSGLALCGLLYLLSPPYTFMGTTLQEMSVWLVLLLIVISFALYLKTYVRVYFEN